MGDLPETVWNVLELPLLVGEKLAQAKDGVKSGYIRFNFLSKKTRGLTTQIGRIKAIICFKSGGHSPVIRLEQFAGSLDLGPKRHVKILLASQSNKKQGRM